MSGIEDSINKLKSLQENLKEIDGEHSYSFKEMFNDDFVSEHTKFSNISDFLSASGFDFSSQESFRNIDISALDKYISENSDLSSWEEMKAMAGKELLSKKLGF